MLTWLPVGSVYHLKALLAFLLDSEGLDPSWKPVLTPLVADAAVLLGHTAWQAATRAAPSSAPCLASAPQTGGDQKQGGTDALLAAEHQSWLKTAPLSFRVGRRWHMEEGQTRKGLVSEDAATGLDERGSLGPRPADKGGVAPVMELEKYLKVKKIDGARPGDSFCVPGIVFSNQVVPRGGLRCVQANRCGVASGSAAVASNGFDPCRHIVTTTSSSRLNVTIRNAGASSGIGIVIEFVRIWFPRKLPVTVACVPGRSQENGP